MTPFIARPYRGDAELDSVVELINACEALDRLDQGTSPAELRSFFEDPEADPARDFRLWEDAGGRLAGCGQLFVDEPEGAVEGRLRIYVHPAARATSPSTSSGQSLGDQIVAWGEGRMRELGNERDRQPRIRSLGRDDIPYRLELVRRNGFAPQRSFLRMARPLDDGLPAPVFPAGFAVRPLGGEREAEAWTDLFNQSFRDHWNHSDYSVAEVLFWLGAPSYRPELNLVAVAPDGRLAAFCWCSVRAEDATDAGAREGWVDELGTHPAFRKRGLGRALLLEGLRRLRDAGIATVRLGVDADNPTGATRLYESVGFRVVYRQVTSVKEL